MSTIAQAVISREAGAPTRVEEMVVEDPGPGEVLVRIQASGVCHTDLHYKLGKINNDFPFLLGHEVAGIVESVGEGVESPGVGEYVVIAWRAPCGNCRFCAIGQPHLCSASLNAKPRMTAKSDGKQLSPALGIGGFCTHTVVSAKQAVPVPRECPPEQACLLGCGVTTGVGAALYTGGVRRGSTVAVYGCGGVGCSVIMGAKLANAKTIIGVDIADNKLAWAKDFGATHVVDATKGDPVEAIKEITGGPRCRPLLRGCRDTGDVAAGALVSGPGGDVHADRGAGPDDGDGATDAAVLRARGIVEGELVRGQPAVSGLPDAGQLVPAGQAGPRQGGYEADQAGGRGGGVRGDGTR